MIIGAGTVSALLELGALPRDDWESALQQIVRIDSTVLGVERVNYWSLHEVPPSIFCELGYIASQSAFERGVLVFERDCPRYFQELRRATVIATEDARQDPRTRELHGYLTARGITSMMDIPVWEHGKLAGVLCHEHVGPPRCWTFEEEDFAVGAAHSVAAALEARERSRAEAAEQREAFLARASWVLSGTLDEQEVAERAVRMALPKLGTAAILDLVEDATLRRAAAAHVDPLAQPLLDELAHAFPPDREGLPLSVRAAYLRQAILVPSVGEGYLQRFGARHAEILRKLGVGSVMAVPILAGDTAIGAMSVLCHHRMSSDDLRLAERYAVRVSLALVNARRYREAQAAIAARDEFMNMAAHELRTPVTALKLAAEALRRNGNAVGLEQARKRIARQTDRLQQLLDRMLDATQISSGRLLVKPQRLDLAALARDIAQDFSATLERAGCTLELHVPAPVVGEWDPVRLGEVISNLLDNAIKFGRGKPISLSVEQRGGSAVVTVTDHGIGIEPARLADIFGRYQRAVPQRAFGGLGLGLYIVRGIVEAHGGSVRVESRRGEGSRFIVELPGAGE